MSAETTQRDAEFSFKSSDTTAELIAALQEAQMSARGIVKDKTNKHHQYNYVSAEQMVKAAQFHLGENGLALIPVGSTMFKIDNLLMVRRWFRLAHKSGQWIQMHSEMPIVPGKGRPEDKAAAAALTSSLNYFLRDLLLIPRFDRHEDMDDPRNDPGDRSDSKRRETPRSNNIDDSYRLKKGDLHVSKDDEGKSPFTHGIWQNKVINILLKDAGDFRTVTSGMHPHQKGLLRIAYKCARERKLKRLLAKAGEDAPLEALAEDAGVAWPSAGVSKLSPFDIDKMERYFDKHIASDE